MTHQFSVLRCADFQPIAALAYQITAPLLVNTGPLDIVCESPNDLDCFGPTGTAGNGVADIETDWADYGIMGCPSPGGVAHRIVIALQDAAGGTLAVSLSGATSELGYSVDMAHPVDETTVTVLPLSCGPSGRPRVLARSDGAAGQVTLALHLSVPPLYSDCTPGSLSVYLSQQGITSSPGCNDAFQDAASVAKLYTSMQSCLGAADLRRSLWTDTGVAPGADGNIIVTATRPADTSCLLVGSTSTIGGQESGAITGFVRVPGLACHDADGDGWSDCEGDCGDAAPAVHPGAEETCNGLDDNCNGLVDEDGLGEDTDGDGVHNLCDNCPTTFNPDQDPSACDQRVVNVRIDFTTPQGHGSGLVAWSTTHEVDVVGFNVVLVDAAGNRVQINQSPIACKECATGLGASYGFFVPKHKSGRNIFIELLRPDGVVERYGPAAR